MKMDFKKYASIENSYRQKIIDSILMYGLSGGEWCCTEKVDGSNFSFYHDGNTIRCAKRSAFLPETHDFFGCLTLREDYDILIEKLYQYFKENTETDSLEMIVYGEIFGGYYNHPEVTVTGTKVQKRISYSPNNEFYPFDIKINGEYIDYYTFEKACEAVGFPVYAKALFIGTFEEALVSSNEFTTLIPAKLGLPPVEENICEGVVIKPVKCKYFRDGSRVILKNKNEKFSEKSNSTKSKQPKKALKLSDEEKAVFNKMFEYLSENRLRSVLSKIGAVNDKMFGKVLGMLVQDLLEDFTKDHEELYAALPKETRKRLRKLLNGEASILIRKNFLNIIDGNF